MLNHHALYKAVHDAIDRRAREEVSYGKDFRDAVIQFLSFADRYHDIAETMADRIVAHAVPVGSGTVARTKRIPIEARAEDATVAWMRHQTTGYDSMHIPREKGRRREVRQMLARRSKELLARYRRGETIDRAHCPLAQTVGRGAPCE